MKYRNIIKNEDGTHNIVWFGSAGKYIYEPITFKISMQSKDHPSAIGSTQISFTKEEIEAGETKSYTIDVGWFNTQTQQVVHNKGKYDITVNEKTATITCTNLSDMVSGTRRAIYTIDLNITDGKDSKTKVIIFDSMKKSSSNFTVTANIPYRKISAENYVDKQEGIAKSLIQWLSVIKYELWYNINYGFPLVDKIRNKATYDAYAIQVISSHPEVKRIKKYTSVVNSGVYTFECVILSIFDEEITISSQANI